jgi:hypothetical protein
MTDHRHQPELPGPKSLVEDSLERSRDAELPGRQQVLDGREPLHLPGNCHGIFLDKVIFACYRGIAFMHFPFDPCDLCPHLLRREQKPDLGYELRQLLCKFWMVSGCPCQIQQLFQTELVEYRLQAIPLFNALGGATLFDPGFVHLSNTYWQRTA